MKITFISLFSVISGLTAFGQTWTAGPKIAFGLNTTVRGDELQVGANGVRLTSSLISSPTLFGGFVRYDRPHWYGQAEGLLGKLETGFVRSNATLGSGADFLAGNRADARLVAITDRLIAGPWLRVFGESIAPDYASAGATGRVSVLMANNNEMNRFLIFNKLTVSILLISYAGMAQTPDSFRFEAEAGVSALHLPTPYRTGGLYHQQLTGYISPRWGVGLGVNWGSSANPDPLKTRYANQPGAGAGAPPLPDPVALRSFYQRSDQMTDLTLVYRPLVSRRHQVRVQAGLSVYHRRELGVDSVRFVDPQKSYYEAIRNATDTRRVMPVAAISYDFRLSARWAVGLTGTAYFTGGGQSATTLGVHTAYRFNAGADSLGIGALRTDGLRVGIRAAASLTTQATGANPGRVYRARLAGGLWADLPLSLTWAIRGEVNYAQRGYRTNDLQTSGGRYPAAFGNLNYLDVPLLFRHEAGYHWYLYGGPYLAFLLNGYTESAGQRSPAVRVHTGSGLVVGTAYNLTAQLAVDVRYQRDLIALSATPGPGFQGFQAGLSWQWRRIP